MKEKIEVVKCDICGAVCTDKYENFSYPVVFRCDQNEGRPCEPYISVENLDVCDKCQSQILRVEGYGAQGFNHYSTKTMNLFEELAPYLEAERNEINKMNPFDENENETTLNVRKNMFKAELKALEIRVKSGNLS